MKKWHNSNITAIKRNPNNPRIIKDDKFKKLVESIKNFPQMLQLRPIVVNKDMVVLGGNMRLKACKEAGLKDVPIIIAEDLTEDQQKEFIIKDNVGFGEWDFEMLANEWDAQELTEWGLDIPDLSMGSILELEEDEFEIPDNIETDIVLGDLFEIADHRLLCGDSVNANDVEKLMGSEKSDMVFTDPPYGVIYQSNVRKKSKKFDIIKNDNVFISEWINNLPLFSNGFVFVWTSWKVINKWIELLSPIGDLTNVIIWDKGGGGIGDLTGTFATDFELALVYNRGAKIIGKRLGSVWSINKDSGISYKHPTQKPVKLAAMAIENVTTHRGLIMDLFLGSGTTMVAAHQLGRKCYGMEIDPKYCQVIVDRMKKLDPDIKIKRNGNPY